MNGDKIISDLVNQATDEHSLSDYTIDASDTSDMMDILDTHGVCVITNYINKETSDQYKSEIIQWLIDHSEGLTEDPKTWTANRLPHGPRKGMMQGMISNCPTLWKIREDLHPLFAKVWETDDLICSLDGATVCPPMPQRYKDWAHLDQTSKGFSCYQGQAVLSNSTSCFVCTPGSHKKHDQVVSLCGRVHDSTNWIKFNDEQTESVGELFGSKYQIPIYSPAGSVILWDSRTIHSARRNNPGDLGWRCTTYVCMRPKEVFSVRQLKVIPKYAIEGRQMNHWCAKVFPKQIGKHNTKVDAINEYSKNPERLTHELTDFQKKMVNIV